MQELLGYASLDAEWKKGGVNATMHLASSQAAQPLSANLPRYLSPFGKTILPSWISVPPDWELVASKDPVTSFGL